ncbi:MAG: PepSY domain-containing protein [Pisciglobus halotolerans]|nr:PepSY domain-containing protein [Pisciglobus halotolerans]
MDFTKGKIGFITLASSLVLMACGNTNQDTDTPDSESSTTSSEMMSSDQQSSTSGMDSSTMSSDSESSATSSSESKGIEDVTFEYDMLDAVDQFNDQFSNAKITSIEIDSESDSYVYEIKGYNDSNSVELEMDANSGEVVKTDDSDDLDDTANDDVLDLDGLISPQEAMKAALDEVGSGYAKEWEIDSKNGEPYYEIDVEDAEQADDDVHIDAKTGDFIGYD